MDGWQLKDWGIFIFFLGVFCRVFVDFLVYFFLFAFDGCCRYVAVVFVGWRVVVLVVSSSWYSFVLHRGTGHFGPSRQGRRERERQHRA